MPQDIPATYDGCCKRLLIEHTLLFPKDGLFLEWHNDAAKEWGALGSWALVPSAITYEPKINSRIIKGERTRVGARKDGGTAKGGADTIRDDQGGSGWTVNELAILARRPGQVEVPAELRSDVSAHSFWKQGDHHNV